jgi:hypothetical protein
MYSSSNDHVGDAGFMVSELLADAPQRDVGTGLYDVDGKHPMKELRLPLSSTGTGKEMPWEAKHNPVLISVSLSPRRLILTDIVPRRAKYQPIENMIL